jgi:hypothetical protein
MIRKEDAGGEDFVWMGVLFFQKDAVAGCSGIFAWQNTTRKRVSSAAYRCQEWTVAGEPTGTEPVPHVICMKPGNTPKSEASA